MEKTCGKEYVRFTYTPLCTAKTRKYTYLVPPVLCDSLIPRPLLLFYHTHRNYAARVGEEAGYLVILDTKTVTLALALP